MTDLWLVIILTSAVCGIAGYIFAKKTERNPLVWTLLGVVLNVFVVALLATRERRINTRA